MATNLVSLVMQFLTPDMIARIASGLGIDRAVAQKAIGGAVPALLSGLAGMASTPGGASQLSGVLAQQAGSFDNVKNLIGAPGQKALADTGSSMLSGLFGGGALSEMRQAIGSFAGIGDGASKSLLGMLGPIVVGALGQQQRSAGLDAGGLAALLTSQKDQIAAAIPPALADRLSAAGLLDTADSGMRSGAAAASRRAVETGQTMTAAARSSASAASSSSSWPYWLATVVVLGGLGWYFMARPGRDVAELPRPAAPASQTGTVGSAPPDLTVGGVNLANRVDTSVGNLKTALGGITDAASAETALPKIQEATAQLSEVGNLATKLPPEHRTTLAKLIATAMPTIEPLCDRVLAMPGVGPVAKPAIDDLRGKLNALSKA